MALFTTMVLIVIAMEIMYQTTVEAKISSQGVNQLKAYYAAKSAAELGLFRVYLYRKAVADFGDSLPDTTMLDLIWNFPFQWPPPKMDELSMVAKDQIDKAVKASQMQGTYAMTIESEGAKIDINDLASPSKVLAETVRAQILQLFQARLATDEEFAESYRGYDFNKLVNNLTDWIDDNKESMNGGDERSEYGDIGSEFLPPNQPFKTLGELHMVANMTDELFSMLAPQVTVYGVKGININHASREILMSLHGSITEDVANKIIEGRQNPTRGPFKNLEDFVNFATILGVPADAFMDGKDARMPLIFDPEFNFRIRATGISGKVQRDITAIAYDFNSVKARLGEILKQQAEKDKGAANPQTPPPAPADPNAPGGKTQTSKDKKKIEVPKARPTVVYWTET